MKPGSRRRPHLLCRAGGLGLWKAGALIALVLSQAAPAPGSQCASPAAQGEVEAALSTIERSLDPCGQSAELLSVVREYRRCSVAAAYPVCVDRESERSFIEQGRQGGARATKITWNPELRSELESGCAGDPRRPVLRDPTASLLHEIVHAVQDCSGRDPADYELETVRIENIFRRAQGLCQRTRYGAELLPSSMIVACEPGHCLCQPAGGTLVETVLPGRRRTGNADAPKRDAENTAGDTKASAASPAD